MRHIKMCIQTPSQSGHRPRQLVGILADQARSAHPSMLCFSNPRLCLLPWQLLIFTGMCHDQRAIMCPLCTPRTVRMSCVLCRAGVVGVGICTSSREGHPQSRPCHAGAAGGPYGESLHLWHRDTMRDAIIRWMRLSDAFMLVR